MKHARRSRAARVVGGSILLLATAAACHSYRPMIDEAPAPGDDVRIQVASETAAQLTERVGQPVRRVRGTVLDSGPGEGLTVDVGWGALYAGTPLEGRRDTITFRPDEVLEVDRRELSRLRTGLLGAGAMAAVVAIFRGFQGEATPGPGPTEPPPVF